MTRTANHMPGSFYRRGQRGRAAPRPHAGTPQPRGSSNPSCTGALPPPAHQREAPGPGGASAGPVSGGGASNSPRGGGEGGGAAAALEPRRERAWVRVESWTGAAGRGEASRIHVPPRAGAGPGSAPGFSPDRARDNYCSSPRIAPGTVVILLPGQRPGELLFFSPASARGRAGFSPDGARDRYCASPRPAPGAERAFSPPGQRPTATGAPGCGPPSAIAHGRPGPRYGRPPRGG